ncbi:MAG: hypothetical protein ACLSG8_10510 [Barnesiella sp.]
MVDERIVVPHLSDSGKVLTRTAEKPFNMVSVKGWPAAWMKVSE